MFIIMFILLFLLDVNNILGPKPWNREIYKGRFQNRGKKTGRFQNRGKKTGRFRNRGKKTGWFQHGENARKEMLILHVFSCSGSDAGQ